MKTYNEGIGSKIFDIFNIFLMIFICIIMIYPLLNTFAISFSSADFISQGKVTWYPKGFNTTGYDYIFKEPNIFVAFRNTVVYALLGTFIMLLLTSLIAYPLTIKEFVFKKFITIFLAITMFFGGGLIPSYLLIRKLKMINTLWVMIIPGAVSAFNVIIFRTFFSGIPKELRESAYIDGANDFTILFKVYLPLSKALLATFALFGIVGVWNSWFNALIYLQDEERYPIQMILRKILIERNDLDSETQKLMMTKKLHTKNIKMAIVMVTIFPILCIYPFLQKYFVTGMMVGSIKG